MKDIPVPGFQAYLDRTFNRAATVQVPSKNTWNLPMIDEASGPETIVVNVKGSSYISRLTYRQKDKELDVVFNDGGGCTYLEVMPTEFAAVADPSEEFEHSVGKAFHKIIRPTKKIKGR